MASSDESEALNRPSARDWPVLQWVGAPAIFLEVASGRESPHVSNRYIVEGTSRSSSVVILFRFWWEGSRSRRRSRVRRCGLELGKKNKCKTYVHHSVSMRSFRYCQTNEPVYRCRHRKRMLTLAVCHRRKTDRSVAFATTRISNARRCATRGTVRHVHNHRVFVSYQPVGHSKLVGCLVASVSVVLSSL